MTQPRVEVIYEAETSALAEPKSIKLTVDCEEEAPTRIYSCPNEQEPAETKRAMS